MTRLHVLIAGGGIGGLVAALALLRRGVAVDVFEQAADPREVGAGVQLAPNGTRVLCALGLESEMTAIASMPAGKEVRLFSTGQSWKLQDLGEQAVARWGAPYWMVHRGDFHRVLREAFEARAPGKLHKGARAEGFTQDADGVTLLLTSGERVCGDALVGADGVHSRIRETLFANERAQFTGIVAWRGVVPMERVPAHMRGAVGVNWIGPHGHVVMYPLRRGELLNMVGAVERDDWRVEGWSIPGSTAECLRDLAAWHPDVHAVIRAIDIPYKWALLSRDALPRWSVGALPCSAMRAIPRCRFWRRAPTWRSRTAWCWRAAWNAMGTMWRRRYGATSRPDSTAPRASCVARRTTPGASTTRSSRMRRERPRSSTGNSRPTRWRHAITGCSNMTL